MDIGVEVGSNSWVWVADFVICEVRLDLWFCVLWLAKSWYGVWVFISYDMGLNFVVVRFVGLAILDGVPIGVRCWRSRLVL